MEFRERLQKATERGQQIRHAKAREEAAQALSEEEFKRLHSKYRIEVSEHIELCLQQLTDQFLGFQFESLVNDRGWGAGVSRDDIGRGGQGTRSSFYSRLELYVSPYSKYHVIELVAKGIIRNKEVYNRTRYQLLGEVDLDSFTEFVDLWVLEYAELYAAQG